MIVRYVKPTSNFFMFILISIMVIACDGGGTVSLGNGNSSPPTSAPQQSLPSDNEITQPAEKTSITFTDTAGTEITLDLPIEKAIVINRNTAEAIKLLGAEDRIVATGDTTVKNNRYLGFQDLPDVGETGEVNLETILSLKPQVVFAYTNRPDQTLEDKLEPAGIRVIRMNNYLPDQMDTELELLGRLFDKEERAAEFLEWKHTIEQIPVERLKGLPKEEKKSVLALSAGFLNSNGGYRVFPSQSIGGKPGVGEGYATIVAGGVDAADLQWDPTEASTTILVDEEYVLTHNPQVITLHGTWLGGYDVADHAPFEEAFSNIMKISSLKQLDAGKTQDVYFFHTNFIGSDKRYIGVLQLAKWLYPERFEGVEADDYARQYFEEWLGAPYQGTWYYSFKEFQ